jgi:hypothetical protein
MTGLKGIYSIFDRKAETYLPPFMEAANGTAIRKMQDMVADSNPNNVLHHHAEDFDLVKLAEFGEISGSVKPVNKEVLINLGKLKQGE